MNAAEARAGRRVLILGAGHYAQALCAWLQEAKSARILGYTEPDANQAGQLRGGLPILGSDAMAVRMWKEGALDGVYLGIGDGNLAARERLYEAMRAEGIPVEGFVHPTAIVATSARIGTGAIILPRVVVGPNARVGENVILFTGAIVEHDCQVGDHAYLSPGVVLSGAVVVGQRAFLGSNSTAIPFRVIGDRAVVGAGAVVIHDVAADETVVGVPAVPIHRADR